MYLCFDGKEIYDLRGTRIEKINPERPTPEYHLVISQSCDKFANHLVFESEKSRDLAFELILKALSEEKLYKDTLIHIGR